MINKLVSIYFKGKYPHKNPKADTSNVDKIEKNVDSSELKPPCYSKIKSYNKAFIKGKKPTLVQPIMDNKSDVVSYCSDITIDKSDNYAWSLSAKKGSIYFKAPKTLGGACAYLNIIHNNPDSIIGNGLHNCSMYSMMGSILTNCKKTLGSILATKNIFQDNSNALIGTDINNRSLYSKFGSVFINAKKVQGDITAGKDIFIIGKVNIKGKVKSNKGKIYLVNARDATEYNIIGNNVKKITKEKYNEMKKIYLQDEEKQKADFEKYVKN